MTSQTLSKWFGKIINFEDQHFCFVAVIRGGFRGLAFLLRSSYSWWLRQCVCQFRRQYAIKKSFVKTNGKTTVNQSSYLTCLQGCNLRLYLKRIPVEVFFHEICEFFRTTIYCLRTVISGISAILTMVFKYFENKLID